jgi:hypothetical protein
VSTRPVHFPCLGVHEIGNKTYAEWDNKWFWNKFIFTWQREGGDLHYKELSGDRRSFYVSDAWRNKTYTFKIQGCDSFLQPGICSQMMTISYTTLSKFPPQAIDQGIDSNLVEGG